MRCVRRRCKCLIITFVINVIIFFILNFWQHRLFTNPTQEDIKSDVGIKEPERLQPTLTIILQDFELFENNVAEVTEKLATSFPQFDVMVISKTLPYPPIKLRNLPNVKLTILKNEPNSFLNGSRPEAHIKTNFVMFIPDGKVIDINFVHKFQQYVKMLDIDKAEGVAVPVKHTALKCHGIRFTMKTWTIEIGTSGQMDKCGYVMGEHGLLLRTNQLGHLSDPFLTPTFTSLYIQLSLVYVKVAISIDMYIVGNKKLYQDPQSRWHHKQSHVAKLKHLYSHLGVKRVIRENKQVDWYGCTKDTGRCFDTVHNDMPEYLYHGRWTPPCCLKALRETAKHVFSILDSCKVRYWLEGGSLLGAARDNDIIPWDYDIDIGIYKDDMIKCTQLAKLLEKGFVDEDGFSWERATEGDFYRVQFSETNHLHVDIFPFFSRNGIMTKNTWFKTHKQDTEFPEHFLTPLTRIKFAGLEASAPNNIKEFLTSKFGKGVIDSPRFPNAETVV